MTELEVTPVQRTKAAIAMVGAAVLVLGYFALGMPGMDHGSSESATMPGMDHSAAAMPWNVIDADAFAAALGRPGVRVINVHVPDEGRIAGTDLEIPYTDIAADARLPANRATPIAVYCQSGRMSTIAAQALTDAGYSDVVELKGGMLAWKASGRTLDRTAGG